MLDWWIDRGMKTDTKEMDTLFHRLAWLGLKDQKTENQKAVSRFGDDRKNTRR